MPPKKPVQEEKIPLGRPGNSLKSGIVGAPGCKPESACVCLFTVANNNRSASPTSATPLCSRPLPSATWVTLLYANARPAPRQRATLFNPQRADKKFLPKQNFPYATIDPEEARVIVPDERFDWLCEKYKPKSVVPANLTVYDIAGLTRGSSTGAGLGNAFLSHIRAVDAIFQVVRSFDDAEIIHIEGDVNPTRDLDIISEELRLKDIEFTEKALENQKKKTRMGGQSLEQKKAKIEQDIIEKILAWLQEGKDVRKGNWSPKEVRSCTFFFLFFSPFLSRCLLHDDKGPLART